MSDSNILWSAKETVKEQSGMNRYQQWLEEHQQKSFDDYHNLWKWSSANPALLWESIWQYFGVKSYSPYRQVMSNDSMPRTRWFEGSMLNFAEHIFRNETANRPALIFSSEREKPTPLSW